MIGYNNLALAMLTDKGFKHVFCVASQQGIWTKAQNHQHIAKWVLFNLANQGRLVHELVGAALAGQYSQTAWVT